MVEVDNDGGHRSRIAITNTKIQCTLNMTLPLYPNTPEYVKESKNANCSQY